MRCPMPVVLVTSLVLLSVGCSEAGSDPAAPGTTATPSLDRAGTIPLSGVCRTTFQLTNLAFQAPPNGNELASADYEDTGACQLSHLGSATLHNSGSIDFTVLPAIGRGSFTLTGANGDRLEGTEEIDFLEPDAAGLFGFTGTRVVSGGTGRFAGAHGSLPVSGSGSNVTGATDQSLSGRLSF